MTQCWICESAHLVLTKPGNILTELTSDSFAITNRAYGVTHDVYRCRDCGFFQCSELRDVLHFYEGLADEAYEQSRGPRSIQERKLLEVVRRFRATGRLLDIGAGSGILVEQALKMGYAAHGIEPSRWLQERARDRGLPVCLGTFPSPNLTPPYDVITLVDVLEHVSNPVHLLRDIRAALTDDGYAFVVTPDVGSLTARVLGKRWWHYRIAHIGYFDRRTFRLAARKSGLEIVQFLRPGWYFDLAYLWDRMLMYAPACLRIPAPSIARKIVLPLNPRDSLLAVCKKGK